MSAELTPHQILSAARLLVMKRAPYFRAGLLQMVARESPGYGTFATTKNWIMLWDPEKAVEFGVEGTAAVLVHELWHLLRDHFGRFAKPLINHDLANIAGDFSINPGVKKMGFKLPKGGVWPKQVGLPDNLTAEEYYEKLSKMDVQYVYFDACTGAAIEDGADDDQASDGKTKTAGKTRVKIEMEGCGSCSGRERRDEPKENDAEGRTESEIQRTRIVIAKAIQSHGRGSVPSDLERWAGEQLRPPKISWREKLARVCRSSIAYRPGGGHSTHTRPSRRQAGLGFGAGCPVLPSYRATTPSATLLVDTSGSMGSEELLTIMSEAKGILEACGARIEVVVCDADVHASKTVKTVQEACALLKGGGGSDFRPAFTQIMEKRPRASVIIAATDGDIDVPTNAPEGVTVIWLLTANYTGAFRAPCDWGTPIKCEA